MKTFERWFQNDLAKIMNERHLSSKELLGEAWNTCASEYEHKLKNVIQAKDMKIAVLERQLKEALGDLDWATGYYHDLLIDYPEHDIDEDRKRLEETRRRHKLDEKTEDK